MISEFDLQLNSVEFDICRGSTRISSKKNREREKDAFLRMDANTHQRTRWGRANPKKNTTARDKSAKNRLERKFISRPRRQRYGMGNQPAIRLQGIKNEQVVRFANKSSQQQQGKGGGRRGERPVRTVITGV